MGNYQGASVHPTMHLFMPPTKRIVFNRNLKSNDGLLANEIVAADGLNYNEALLMIDKYVQASEKTLNEGKKLTLDKVGNLFYDIEKNLQFEADSSMNYLMESYGLASVQSFPVKRDTVYAGRDLKSMEHPMEQVLIHKNNYSKHLWKAAVVVPLIGLGIWFSINTHVFDRKNISQDSLNPFNNKTEVLAPNVENTSASKASVTTAKTSSESTPTIINENPSEKKINEAVITSAPAETPATATGNYFIVAGCFKVLENANKYVESLKAKGFNATISGQTDGGLNRVIYNSYSTKEEASAALVEIRKQDANAWLLTGSGNY